MTSPQLVEKCDRYLESLHCVLWGQAFNAHHPKGRAEAAEWLAQQIEGVNGESEEIALTRVWTCEGCPDCQPQENGA